MVRHGDLCAGRRHVRTMRYSDCGGLSPKVRADWEAVRFAAGWMAKQVAERFRVTPKSANLWRTAWREGGRAAL